MRQPVIGDRIDIRSPARWIPYSGVITKTGSDPFGEPRIFVLADDGETREFWVGEIPA